MSRANQHRQTRREPTLPRPGIPNANPSGDGRGASSCIGEHASTLDAAECARNRLLDNWARQQPGWKPLEFVRAHEPQEPKRCCPSCGAEMWRRCPFCDSEGL